MALVLLVTALPACYISSRSPLTVAALILLATPTHQIPDYPAVLCFGPGVPAFVELTAYDVPDKRVGRPVGVVRISDVVRCVDGNPPWLKVTLLSAPEGAWVHNTFGGDR